jgi:hypothetical protein
MMTPQFKAALKSLVLATDDCAYRTLYYAKQLFLVVAADAKAKGVWNEQEAEWLPFSMASSGVDFPLEWTQRIASAVDEEAGAAVAKLIEDRPILAQRLRDSRQDGAGHYVYLFPKETMCDGLHPGWTF